MVEKLKRETNERTVTRKHYKAYSQESRREGRDICNTNTHITFRKAADVTAMRLTYNNF